MTDKELLALAAYAHGGLEYVPGCGWIHVAPDGTRGAWWNPLTDDGDALRLAVKLGIALTPYPVYQHPKQSMLAKQYRRGDTMRESNPTEVIKAYGGDPYAATRLTIVSCAAKIGKNMP